MENTLNQCASLVLATEELTQILNDIEQNCFEKGNKINSEFEKNLSKIKSEIKVIKKIRNDIQDGVKVISEVSDIIDKQEERINLLESIVKMYNENIDEMKEVIDDYKNINEKQSEKINMLNEEIKNLKEKLNIPDTKANQSKIKKYRKLPEGYPQDSLLAIIIENKYEFPIDVRNDSWSVNFHFVINNVEGDMAVGRTFVDEKIYKKKAAYPLKKSKFKLYKK